MKAYFENRDSVSDDRDFLARFPVEAVQRKDLSFLAHWHNDIELAYVCRGSISVGVNSDVQVLREGDIAFCNSGDIHFYDSRDSASDIIIIMLNPVLISAVASQVHQSLGEPFILGEGLACRGAPAGIHEAIRDRFFRILHEMQSKDLHYDTMVRGQLIELLGLLLRYVSPQKAKPPCDNRLSMKRKEVIRLAINYIEENFSSDISLDEVADFLGVSRFYLSRIFNQLTGQPFKIYLNNLRVEKAFGLLTASRRSITDIAFECGFNSIRTFNRVFKELKGIVPSSFR